MPLNWLKLFCRCWLVIGLVATVFAAQPESGDDCNCGDSAADQAGHALRGKVLELPEAADRIIIEHTGIPGLLKPGQTEFIINPSVRAQLRPGQTIMAKADPLPKGGWELFAIRLLAPVAKP